MLTSATKTGTTASFVYDPNLRQIQKTVGSTKTKYVYSGSHMMEEWNGTANTLTTRYVYAGAEEPVLQMNSSGTVTYIHHDHHGSVIAQSGSSGAVGNKYKYGPFGESATLTGTTIGYTGQRFDSETGLYHYRARYYMPSIGRFLQADPVGYEAGMNLYAHCVNDPMDHTDPNGLEDEPVPGGHMEYSAHNDALRVSLHMIDVQVGNAATVVKVAKATGAAKALAGAAVGTTLKALRNRAVRQAWKDEQALLVAGLKGTRNWTEKEIETIKRTGSHPNIEGHHTLNVKGNPLHAPNEDYIKFVEKGKEHLANHNGNFKNPTTGVERFDRKSMLKEGLAKLKHGE